MIFKMLGMAMGVQRHKLPHPETAKIARQAAAGGMVLLKNDGTLPISPRKVALFGTGAEDTVCCGTGSGYAFSPYKVNVRKGLENAGFSVTSVSWLKRYFVEKKAAEKAGSKLSLLDKYFSGITVFPTEPEILPEELAEARSADTAIYVITRNTGENFDRKAEKGDYYLSDQEEKNIRLLSRSFAHTVVILNTCIIDATVLESIPGISAIVLMGAAGLETGNALADILTGNVTPSGKLTDTWAKHYDDYPASATFSANDGNTLQEDYCEDIFVGYRYFDTFGKDVTYPFGYGLSYTTFTYENVIVTADWQNVTVQLDIKNTGKAAGREIVQVYASAPAGKLIKPYQELKAYGKTKLLQPGEKETLTMTFTTEALSSFCETRSAWVMEPGDYLIRVGSHSRATEVAAAIRLDDEAILRYCSRSLAIDKHLDLLKPEVVSTENYNGSILYLYAAEAPCVQLNKIDPTIVTYLPEGSDYRIPERKFRFPDGRKEVLRYVRNVPNATLLDVQSGKVTMEEFVASLDMQTLLRLITGTGSETKHPVPGRLGKNKLKSPISISSSGKTTGQYVNSLGIPAMSLADGPAGLHLMGRDTTAYPVGMVIAQNWDTEMAAKVGDCFGMEMESEKVSISLGPGMNIHRDPLCGRNFEYYSEDPVLTGNTAAAFTRGLQENHPGYGVALKHFAANNQELDRVCQNNTISQRALREIYLKGFEICVRTADPKTVMSSYNCINGIHTSSNYELLTDILRGDWGFAGLVMTDWDSQSEKDLDIHAGNDLIMGGYPTNVIAAAVEGVQPKFDDDGAIHQDKLPMYGGLFKRDVDAWGCFKPDKNGTDTRKVALSKEKPLSDRAKPFLESGAATIHEDAGGSRYVLYRGTDRGAYLPLGDVQRNAIRVLRYLMDGAPMRMMQR